MPNRYYTERLALGNSGKFMTLLFIDTSPCVSDYRNDNSEYWDPCSDQYPTCSQVSDLDILMLFLVLNVMNVPACSRLYMYGTWAYVHHLTITP